MSDLPEYRFRIVVDSTLSVDQIWPDGDAPDNPTLQDVLRVAEEYAWSDPTSVSGMRRLIDEWNLDGEASFTEVTDVTPPNRDWCAEATRQRDRADRAEARLRVLQSELKSVADVMRDATERIEARVPVTCDVCGYTVPSGWPCSCDDGRE